MKIKSFIFVLYLCALILNSSTAIELSKDGKQFGATKESNTKIGDRGQGHVDGGWGFWGSWRGWKGWIEWTGFGGGPRGKGKPVGNEGSGGGGGGGGGGGNQGRGEQIGGWERVQNERPKWGGEQGREGENRGTKERPWIPSTWIPNA